MHKPRSADRLSPQIRAEATEWLVRFSEAEVDVPAREDFNRWLRTSPEHVRAYLRVSAFWQAADRMEDAHGQRDIDALVRLAQREANIVSLDVGSPGEQHAGHDLSKPSFESAGDRRGVRYTFALAAAIVLAVGAAMAAGYIVNRAPAYTTGIGEQRTVNLPDGSTVVINAQSRIKLRFTAAERAIELRDGQALFRVARQPGRPFIVRSAGASVRALGTEFDVYKQQTNTVVTVVEGRVAVSPVSAGQPGLSRLASKSSTGEARAPTLLSAGERAVVNARSAHKTRLANPEAITAWTAGLLVFDGASLSEVVREFNRQNAKPLVLSGAELPQLKISGTFPANGAERLSRFLQDRFGVRVDETDDEIRLSRP